MKKQTATNLVSVLTVLAVGPETVEAAAAKTGLSTHQINALEGIWSNKAQGAKALFTRKTVGGHSFLVITEDGLDYKAPAAGAPKATRAPALTEEAARAALLAELNVDAAVGAAAGSEA